MKRVAAAIFVLLVAATPVAAWTETYCWATVTGATSYKFDSTIDNGVTWITQQTLTVPITTPAVCPAGNAGVSFTGSATTLILFRVQTCNVAGCTIRATSGLWHNEAWAMPALPAAPTGLVVN